MNTQSRSRHRVSTEHAHDLFKKVRDAVNGQTNPTPTRRDWLAEHEARQDEGRWVARPTEKK